MFLLTCSEKARYYNTVLLPLFENILLTSTYPDMWKLANVTPIFKTGDKQLIKNYRPIPFLPICGKMFEKLIFNDLYSYLIANSLIPKTNRVYIQVIPQQTNYYIL